MLQNRKGFTLIELLIVVVIIGILAAIAIPKFSATREKAYFSAMKSDLKNLQTQQEIYYSATDPATGQSNYKYTDVLLDLGFAESQGVKVTVTEAKATGWSAKATHKAFNSLDTQGCVVFFGDGVAPVGHGAEKTPGVVTCTGEK